jgi:hypothetical protein
MTDETLTDEVDTAEGQEFACAICAMTIYQTIAIDPYPICAMCRYFCSIDGRWGHWHDGIGPAPEKEARTE